MTFGQSRLVEGPSFERRKAACPGEQRQTRAGTALPIVVGRGLADGSAQRDVVLRESAPPSVAQRVPNLV